MAGKRPQGGRAFFKNRPPGKSACFRGARVAGHEVAVERGVGGDQTVQSAVEENLREIADVGFIEIRGDFEQQRNPLAVLGGEFLLLLFENVQQPGAGFRALEVAQAGRVRRGQIHGHVVGHRIGFAQADQIIVRRVFIRRVFVFPDVEADDSMKRFRRADVLDADVDAWIVEAHAVDDRLLLDQAEQPGFRVSRLRTRGDRAHFNAAEAQAAERVDRVSFLVQASGEADSVRKFQAHDFHRRAKFVIRRNEAQQTGLFGDPQGAHTDMVGDFRIQAEQQGTGEGIHCVEHERKLIQDRRLVEPLMCQNGTSRAKNAASVNSVAVKNFKSTDFK